MKDILGEALLDWHKGEKSEILWINNKYGDPEEMPIEYYFREPHDLPELEAYALKLCKGKILDVGAGAGAHALVLQSNNLEVDALEISAKACTVLRERGVKNIVQQDIFKTTGLQNYDTVLMLMNGLGISQSIAGLEKLLLHLRSFLSPSGQILFDSSDIHYLYDHVEKPHDKYYGEIDYQYQYKNKKGDWFNWLYIDFAFCSKIATSLGYTSQLIAQDEQGHFLCSLTIENEG